MQCRVCDGENFSTAIDLGMQPWGNHFLKKEEVGTEPFYPLRVIYCHDCRTAQLDYTVKKEVMFADHTYLSGTTSTLSNHFKFIAKEVDERFFEDQKKKRVLDIGSNDGTQLKHYRALGYEVLGVESSKQIAKIANDAGVPTVHAFFNQETADRINQKFDVVNASGVFFHLEELHSVTSAIKSYLQPKGVFVVQFLYMKSIMENRAFDQIYHEHLLYYNLKTLRVLLRRHGLDLFDAYLSPIHGGSIISFVSHAGAKEMSARLRQMIKDEEIAGCNELAAYQLLSARMKGLKADNLQFLQRCKADGKTVYGMGAPVKGNTLLNYFGIGTDLISHLVEKNELRKGLFSPGMHIPIVIERETAPPDVYYGLAWNFKKEILKNNAALIDRGVQFYFPINPMEPV